MSFDPVYTDYISQIKLPGSNTIYHIKDSEARDWIEQLASAGIKFTIAWNGESAPEVQPGTHNAVKIPFGVEVVYNQVTYTGVLVADATTAPYIQLVYERTSGTGANVRKIYGEYITVTQGTGESGDPYTYFWEKLGNTDIIIDDLGELAFKDTVTTTTTTSKVLGDGTTVTVPQMTVTITGSSSDTFVKSYPGATSKLSTTTITGVSGATTASKATAGTAVKRGSADAGSSITCAKAASSATNVSRISLTSGNTSILETASVNNECLTFGSASVTQSSVTGTNGTETFSPAVTTTNEITPYTFADVTVPIAASSATTVATGSLSSEATGATVMTGLGTATTASAITAHGTGTTPQTNATITAEDIDAVVTVTTTVA